MEIERKSKHKENAEKFANNFDYSDLPMEIILYIFTFLPYKDGLKAGTTCSRWREAFFQSKFNRTGKIHFAKVCLSDNEPPGKCLLKSKRFYRTFHLEDVTFGHIDALSNYIGQMVNDITIDFADISEKQFYTFIHNLTNLDAMTITRCSNLFMSGSLLDGKEEVVFTTVRHLSLRQNQYLSDAIFMRLTSSIKAMESLDMSGCHIACHNAVYNRFYPNADTRPNESILTFKIIGRVILKHSKTLRDLDLSYTMVNGGNLEMLILNNDISLRQLKLAACRQLNSSGITAFLKTQPFLKVLDLTDTICLHDENVQVFVEKLPLIEELNVSGCLSITNVAAVCLGNLEYLKSLNISRCTKITSDGIMHGIARRVNTKLRQLQMSHLKICEQGMLCIALNCVWLKQLNVDHCGITDTTLWRIIKHLRWLRKLSVDSCLCITDASLIGNIKVSNNGLHSSTLSGSETWLAPLYDINNERVLQIRDAQIEWSKSENISGIQSLKGLQYLNLSGCNKITDVTLIYGLKFIELTYLNLSNCQKISYVGIKVLVSNCPSIERLDLSYCCAIDDKVIQLITVKLCRLTELHINGCSQLTDITVDAILMNCKSLKTLSARRCCRIHCDIEERLHSMKTLHTLNIDNINDIENEELHRLKR